MNRLAIVSSLVCVMVLNSVMSAQEKVFSGPQVGEKLAAFTVQGVFDDEAGKKIEPLKAAGERPVVLIFVHEVTRPSVGLTRVIGDYATKLGADKLAPFVVLLHDDATEGENMLKRARHAYPQKVPLAISADGAEGPGAYGLNRKVALTILVGKAGKVSANFALVQPSIQVDGPKIGKALHAALGEDKTPTLAELGAPGATPARGEAAAVDLRALLAPVIKLGASEEDVTRAAEVVEAAAKKDAAARTAVGQATKRIVDSGNLKNYGTPKAQEYLKKWAEEFNR
jgi:hypothetical protein